MVPNEPEAPDAQERERLEREVMDLHAKEDDRATRSALRRLPIVLVTMVLLGLLLRWLAS